MFPNMSFIIYISNSVEGNKKKITNITLKSLLLELNNLYFINMLPMQYLKKDIALILYPPLQPLEKKSHFLHQNEQAVLTREALFPFQRLDVFLQSQYRRMQKGSAKTTKRKTFMRALHYFFLLQRVYNSKFDCVYILFLSTL